MDDYKELVARLNKWGASGHTMELFIGKRNLGHDCMEAAEAIERLSELLKATNRRADYWKAEHLEGNKTIERLSAELETERMRLAALGYFDGCKDEYRSASLDDTLRLYEENKALKSASAEPVAWMTKQGGWVRITDDPKNPDGYDIPLYTAPAAVQEEWQWIADRLLQIAGTLPSQDVMHEISALHRRVRNMLAAAGEPK